MVPSYDPRMNIDKLNHTQPRAALQVAYDCIDRLQNHPAHLGLMAIALLLKEMSAVHSLPVSELLNKAERLAGDMSETYTTELRALRAYIKEEMK